MATTPSPLRADRFIWFARIVQFIFVIIVLGVAGGPASTWVNVVGCSVPQRLAWNVACASLTLILLLYLIPTTGRLSLTPLWNPWLQIGLDALFLVFWIAAAATSAPTCGDLCSACSNLYDSTGVYNVWSPGLSCTCSNYAKKRSVENLLAGRSITPSEARMAEKAITIATRQGFDAVLVFLFALTLGYGIYKIRYVPTNAAAYTSNGQDEELDLQEQHIKAAANVTETAA